jgi:acyl-CoA dehydrogenase
VGRLGVAGSCLGLACWALEQTVEYARVRQAFDRPIGELQSIQNMLADCALDIYAASSLIQNCAWLVDEGKPCRMHVSLAKVASTEAAGRVFDRCIQVHGAMGLSNELRLEEGYRFVRSMRIPDGTSEIHRRMVGQALVQGECLL